MARYTCPSCGSRYNGRKCRSCLYEQFTEEITHGSHIHVGEPLVIDAPVRKPIRRKDPFGCEKQTRKKHPIAGFLVLLALINTLLPMLRSWGLELEAMEDLHIAAEPEPDIQIPASCMTLYEGNDILVLADWREGEPLDAGIPIYVQNDSDEDICVSSQNVVVNGFLMEYSSLFASPDDGQLEMTTLYLHERDLLHCGIGVVQELSFSLEIYERGSYEDIDTTGTITLTADVPEDPTLYTQPQGQTVFDQDGIQVDYLGYEADLYRPEDFLEGSLLFYIENTTDHTLQIYLTETSLNAEQVNITFWCELPAHTRTVTSAYLYALEDLEIDSWEDLTQLTFRLNIDGPAASEFFIQTDPISVSITD